MTLALLATGGALCLSGFALSIAARWEGERTPARRALGFALLAPLPFLLVGGLDFPGRHPLAVLLLAAVWLPPLACLVPTGRPRAVAAHGRGTRIDERTVMFSRAALRPGGRRFEDYYAEHPEHRAADDRWRSLAGLMSPGSGKFEPVSFAAAAASFAAVEQLAGLVEGQAAPRRVDLDPERAAVFIKGWARKLGAVSCGITRLQPEHLYSVKGRGVQYGRPVELDHPFAIALAVEMDHRQLGQAPEGATLMESAQQYLASGSIAVQVAECLRRLGWSAEAHIDANYKVVCPLVARDAGLGEIGRMGLLMTPRLGPRVRLAVVTTDLPLPPDPAPGDATVLDFCRICRKCADNCPPGAIPAGEPGLTDGIRRWRIDQEACFSFWCAVGTDCGRCVKVCPYAHPDEPLHRLVRLWLPRSALFRRLALHLDDALYGRRPGPVQPARWLPRRSRFDAGDARP